MDPYITSSSSLDSYPPTPFSFSYPSSSFSHSSRSAPSLEQPEKKKRRQNQACDACRARRIKCDLGDSSSSSSSSTPSCSKCASKGIQCTTLRNLARPSSNRTGPRIEEAKRIYGSVSAHRPAGGGGGQLQPNQPELPTLSVFGISPGRRLPQIALRQAVEQDLLETYFRSTHFGNQVIDPVRFKRLYNEAGQLSEYLSEANQVLVTVMCAAGARYSSNPSILPSSSGCEELSRIGASREPVCDVLLQRALTILDTYGTLRKPSRESIEALTLLIPLVGYQEETRALVSPSSSSNTNNGETRLLEVFLAEHVESLDLWEEARDPSSVKMDEGAMSLTGGEEVRVMATQLKNHRILMSCWIWDSFRAAASRRAPRFADEAIFEICPQIPRFGNPLPEVEGLADTQCFLLFISSYAMLGEILRYAAKNITRRRSAQPLNELEKAARVFWTAMDDFSTWFDALAQRLLGRFKTLSTFSPSSWYVTIKIVQSLSYILVHQTLRERSESEQRATSPRPFFDSPSTTSTSTSTSASTASSLTDESLELTLTSARSTARVVAKTLRSSPFASAGNDSELKEVRFVASFLAEIPVVEQGFLGTPPTSLDWTWETKVREVSWLLEGMERAGRNWGVNAFALESVRSTMVAKTPSNLPPFEFNPLRPSSLVHHSVAASSSTSTGDSSFAARAGGVEVPGRDVFIGPAFSLDSDGGGGQQLGLEAFFPPPPPASTTRSPSSPPLPPPPSTAIDSSPLPLPTLPHPSHPHLLDTFGSFTPPHVHPNSFNPLAAHLLSPSSFPSTFPASSSDYPHTLTDSPTLSFDHWGSIPGLEVGGGGSNDLDASSSSLFSGPPSGSFPAFCDQSFEQFLASFSTS